MSTPSVPGASQRLPDDVPPEYAAERPDRRAPLMIGGESFGQFVNRQMAEDTRRFLEKHPGNINPRSGGGR